MKILLLGRSGLVGSTLFKELKKSKRNSIILSPSSKNLNLIDFDKTKNYLNKVKPDHVYLAAAKVGGIYANEKYQGEFIYENLMISTNVIHASYLANVKKLLFLGSSCIYPKKTKQPIKENYLLTGSLEPTNSAYAVSKIAGIKMCEAYRNQFNKDFRSVMPTNIYGKNDNFDNLDSHVLPALINKIHQAKIENRDFVEVWGTGKPKRDFMYSDDLARACVKIMNISKMKYNKLCHKNYNFINIGSGKEISIRDLANKICKVIGYDGKLKFNTSMKDGTYRKLLDNTKLAKLNFKEKFSLDEGIKMTYVDFLKKNEKKI